MTVTLSPLFVPLNSHLSPDNSLSLLQDILNNNSNLSKKKSAKSEIPQKMGLKIVSPSNSEPHSKTKKVFLLSNYILLAAASSCIFLTLSLRLIPSLCGFSFICLHLITILGALAGCHAASTGGTRWYGAHMAATVLTTIFQGSIAVLIFTRSDDFLVSLKSYVEEHSGVMILKLAGGLCVVMFCLEWVVLTVAFFLKYYAVVEGCGGDVNGGIRNTAKVVSSEEEMGYLPYPSAAALNV